MPLHDAHAWAVVVGFWAVAATAAATTCRVRQRVSQHTDPTSIPWASLLTPGGKYGNISLDANDTEDPMMLENIVCMKLPVTSYKMTVYRLVELAFHVIHGVLAVWLPWHPDPAPAKQSPAPCTCLLG